MGDGRLALSVNPTLAAPDAYSGPAEPQLLAFPAGRPDAEPRVHHPAWTGTPPFTYAEPQRIRLCCPNVGLRGRAAHVLAIGDISNPCAPGASSSSN